MTKQQLNRDTKPFRSKATRDDTWFKKLMEDCYEDQTMRNLFDMALRTYLSKEHLKLFPELNTLLLSNGLFDPPRPISSNVSQTKQN